MIDQLPLNIQLRDDATVASFYAGNNGEALSTVAAMPTKTGEPFVYLWGQMGVGRTHLLQAACHRATEIGKTTFYCSLAETGHQTPSFLQGIENISLVCLDDIEAVSGQPNWEEALFHLYNRIRLENGQLLVAAGVAPKDLSIQLQDLKSRLSSGVTYQLHRLNDEQKVLALQLRAEQRGLHLSKTVGQFLLSHCARSMAELFSTLEILDRASLAEQRRLTIPFIKRVLAI